MTQFKSGSDWTFAEINEAYEVIEKISNELFQLDIYRPQIEIINSEQMIDAHASSGLPVYYPHWSFGKIFVSEHDAYIKGRMGLAYEIVINSNPCIAYLMEDNTMMMQCLVIAHACFGHNAFFKGNIQFKQWTDAESVIDYLVYAKNFILECEEKYGVQAVELIVDAAHAISSNSIDRYKRPPERTRAAQKQVEQNRLDHEHSTFNDMWRTIPQSSLGNNPLNAPESKMDPSVEPEENLLYFIEQNSPILEPWQREILTIVRRMSQYFYPQMQTKVMNEGFATFVHYHIMQEMYNRGLVDDGFMMEFLASHTGVVRQREFSRINPYALGFNIFQDIRRMCENPTDEDREWFPDIAGNPNWVEVVKFAAFNFKDESFIQQYLSPKVIRDMGLMHIENQSSQPYVRVKHVQDNEGYKAIRERLAEQCNVNNIIPSIEVTGYHKWTDRRLELRHTSLKGERLDQMWALQTMDKIKSLWGYDVDLYTFDYTQNGVLVEQLSTKQTQ